MNKSTEPLIFDVDHPEQARWLSIMLTMFQTFGVNYRIKKDMNLVCVTVL